MSYNNLKVIEALSPRQRLEQRIQAAERLGVDEANVHAIKHTLEGNYILRNHIWGANIVTDVGDTYYAQKAAGDASITPEDFAVTGNRLILRTGTVATPLKTHTYTNVTTPLLPQKPRTAGYPKTNDGDTLNSVTNKQRKVTWKYEYLVSEANSTGILGGAIHNGGDSPAGTVKLLTHFNFTASFDKTSSDTLTVYVNHELLGS